MTDTPYLAIDLARLDRNLQSVAELARNAHVDLRPHAKTCLLYTSDAADE